MTLSQHRRLRRLEALQRRVQDRFSTSYMDVRRAIPQPGLPVAPIVEIYSNIVVRTTRQSVDAANVGATSATPVITSFNVHMPVETDVRNGDIIIVKHVNTAGYITDAFRGTAANPYVNDGRKHISMAMSALSRDDIRGDVTEVPPMA